MDKLTRHQIRFLVIVIATAVFVFNIIFAGFLYKNFYLVNKSESKKTSEVWPTMVPAHDEISYKGEEGKSALEILEEKTDVGFDNSGLVVRIGERDTDPRKEYWAFYVNGEYAQVGPKEYQTQSTDLIEWKVERIK